MDVIKLLVLNLLYIEPMSVYDIKSTLNNLDAMRWSNVLIGSIQNAVNTLHKSGAIEIEYIESVGKRKKTIYRITDLGVILRKKETINAIENIQPNLPYNFFIGLSGISSIESEQRNKTLSTGKNKLLQEKDKFMYGIQVKEGLIELDETQKLVIDYTICMLDEQMKLIDDLISLGGKQDEN